MVVLEPQCYSFGLTTPCPPFDQSHCRATSLFVSSSIFLSFYTVSLFLGFSEENEIIEKEIILNYS
jgi:hypothetical protein